MGSSRAALLAFTLVLAAASRPAGAGPRIVNGTPTQAYPSTGVLLGGTSAPAAHEICSGTMIGCSTFLTAAHCVRGASASNLFVYLQHAGVFPVQSFTINPDSTSRNFPLADVAVVKLAAPMTGIRPMHVNDVDPGPSVPATGTIVGFGRTGGPSTTNVDYGIKRVGQVTTKHCNPAVAGYDDQYLVCWDFANPIGPPGTNSNTCNGDSGGPLFMDLGNGQVLAGTTSGGTRTDCLAGDNSYDVNLQHYRSWIKTLAGTDFEGAACGAVAQVGDSDVVVVADSGTLVASQSDVLISLGTFDDKVRELRVTLNGVDDGVADFDLYVAPTSSVSASNYTCKSNGSTPFESCVLAHPQAGTWWARIVRYAGSGPYQLTVTAIPCRGCC